MNHWERAGDEELVRNMSGGCEDAFGAIYQRCGPAVYRFALHMTTDRQLAEEISQDTFMTLIRNPRGYDKSKGTLISWLLGIARNLIRRATVPAFEIDAIEETTEEIAASFDVAGDLARRETIGAVRQAIDSLPAVYREVVVLCELQELNYIEAASILKCPVGTVRSRLHRARNMLASKLQTRCFV